MNNRKAEARARASKTLFHYLTPAAGNRPRAASEIMQLVDDLIEASEIDTGSLRTMVKKTVLDIMDEILEDDE